MYCLMPSRQSTNYYGNSLKQRFSVEAVGRVIAQPPKEVHILLPGTCEYVRLHGIGELRSAHLEGVSRGARSDHRAPMSRKGDRRVKEGPASTRAAPSSWKKQGTGRPLEPPGSTRPCATWVGLVTSRTGREYSSRRKPTQ